LHVLGQAELARVLFPIGGYHKEEVRALATRFGLPVASKGESQDLCFLADGDYRRFLRQHAPEASQPGPIVNQAGRQLGQHQGLPAYTIGQRKGLGVFSEQPLFVLAKDPVGNALVVGHREELGSARLLARDVNWVAGAPPSDPFPAEVKIRYKAVPAGAILTPLPGGEAIADFDQPVVGATAGQGAVFYRDEVCLGGGLIADPMIGREVTP
jgi:tRNA-specific 2-thiouridylase